VLECKARRSFTEVEGCDSAVHSRRGSGQLTSDQGRSGCEHGGGLGETTTEYRSDGVV
jgi:hypothetical protein